MEIRLIMASNRRDDFSRQTIEILAKRVTLIAYLETVIFRFFDRQQEFAADEFSGMLGCADGLK